MRDAEHIEPTTRAAWRRWLSAHHAQPQGVWVIFKKKAAAGPGDAGYAELVEEALCFGWVDSRPGSVDDARTRLYFAPRKPGSGWAATNKARIARLVESGQMHAAGQRVIDAAKADGSWSRLDSSEAGTVPDDLARALRSHAGAKKHWDAFPPGARKAILQWIELAKTAPTRARRIAETAAKAAKNERANEWVPRGGRAARAVRRSRLARSPRTRRRGSS